MNIAGIVAEYNPFHLGHEYHIDETRRRLGADTLIVCAMSGDFVQRGEAALYSKYARAEAAVLCGADLVLELPLPWALMSAEGFARGAVSILAAAGATHLSFGSEAGDIAPLEALADYMCRAEAGARIKELLSQDASLSYAAARQLAAEEALGDSARLLALPNNILAVEYLKAIRALDAPLAPMTVARRGAGHDAPTEGEILSAMELRRRVMRGEGLDARVPAGAAEVYRRERAQGRELASRERLELAVLSRLRMLSLADFEALPDASAGVGRRLYDAARREATLDAVLAAAKTKRYALSRLRRMCMCAALGVTADMCAAAPPYLRVLAANERGCAQLRRISADENALPVVTKPAAVKALSSDCTKVFAVGVYAHDLFALAYPAEGERKGGEEWRISPKIVKNP